jgi:hypothetical protein
MLRMRVLIHRPMQALWILLFHALAWLWWSFFDGSCFGHALSNVCQYATTYEKVAQGLSYAFIKTAQTNIKNGLPSQRSLGRGDLHAIKFAWILVWSPKKWIHLWKQGMKTLSYVVFVNFMGCWNGKDLISKYLI